MRIILRLDFIFLFLLCRLKKYVTFTFYGEMKKTAPTMPWAQWMTNDQNPDRPSEGKLGAGTPP